jgi:small ligand-binding sensory domain FIST
MSLLRSCWDVAPMVLLGCRTDGAIGMSLRWCYMDVAPMVLYGCRSYGAYYRVTAPEVRHHNKNIDGKGI